jgi:DNA-binding response OmpR family regulator
MRVLIVDDHQDTADTLQTLLRAAGHDVRVAYRGNEAIDVASDFVPQLALVDIQLPDISGLAVAKQLRKQSGRRVNIVAITGGDGRQLRFASNFDQHAQKPVSAAQLYQLIDAAREGSKSLDT